jgi:hypothetical protein
VIVAAIRRCQVRKRRGIGYVTGVLAKRRCAMADRIDRVSLLVPERGAEGRFLEAERQIHLRTRAEAPMPAAPAPSKP